MKRFAMVACVLMLGACSTYTTPGAGVSLSAISENEGDIAAAFRREPAVVFPAQMAVVRVASPGYRSGSNESMGTGAFAVVTTRDIETDESFMRLGAMPQVSAVAPISRLLVPANMGSIRDLRSSAAQLKADVLLIYTVDTRFRTESAQLGPLQTIALGFLPSEKAVVTATCAFMIVDVRTGFIYGTGESTVTEDQRSNIWGTAGAIEAARLTAERRAFENSLGEVAELWVSVVATHAGRPPA